jgi:hypothetical protein
MPSATSIPTARVDVALATAPVPGSVEAAPDLRGEQVAQISRSWGGGRIAVAGDQVGDATGYASIDAAVQAAQTISAGAAPGVVVVQPVAGRAFFDYQLCLPEYRNSNVFWRQPTGNVVPYDLEHDRVRSVAFAAVGGGGLFVSHEAPLPAVRAIVDGSVDLRNPAAND